MLSIFVAWQGKFLLSKIKVHSFKFYSGDMNYGLHSPIFIWSKAVQSYRNSNQDFNIKPNSVKIRLVIGIEDLIVRNLVHQSCNLS